MTHVACRLFAGALMCIALTGARAPEDYRQDAEALDETIAANYAYLEKLPNGELPQSDPLTREREAVHDDRSLLAYAEHRIATLADHHAITGASFADSWAVVPTYADLWIVRRDERYRIDAVREGSPAQEAGVQAGDTLIAVQGTPIEKAIAAFWEDIGVRPNLRMQEYAARLLAAGRRDRARLLTIRTANGSDQSFTLPNLYADRDETPPLSVENNDGRVTVRFHNSLGDSETITAFDDTMRRIAPGTPIVLDLRDTPSGGNTTVARAIMGWFVDRPTEYQVHDRPVELRRTGVARRWVEQVVPRGGNSPHPLPTVLVGRWTGSMGEGIAVGFAAFGAQIHGDPMAGLNGSIEDLPIGESGMSIKLPTERLFTMGGTPREDFAPDKRD